MERVWKKFVVFYLIRLVFRLFVLNMSFIIIFFIEIFYVKLFELC